MAGQRRFVLFELNEVPLRVVRHFAAKHPRSSFAKILKRGRRYDTFTPDEGHLSPWITWPTLHRGVPGRDHHIVALGQDTSAADRKFPPVWTLLAAAGRRVGMFGSLHSYPLPRELGQFDFYVPDTFAAGVETKPPELSPFQRFNLSMVDRSGRNVSNELPVKEALRFLLNSLPVGLRPITLAKIARQVASERIWRYLTSRRRTIQSLLAFDFFLAQFQSNRPDAAFFFTNHVASSMHRYWPATFPQDYQATQWRDSWVRRFSSEIDYTMSEADQMLAQLMAFADKHPEYLVLVCGSMGQAAVDGPQAQISTEVLLRDMNRFLDALGVRGTWKRRRTMEPAYTINFEEQDSANTLLDALNMLKVAGQGVPHRRLDRNGVEFVLGHSNIGNDQFTVTIGNRFVSPAEVGLANVPIEDEVGAAAYHVPEGMLLAYDPRQDALQSTSGEPIATTRITPTLLALQGIVPPAYMERPLEAVLPPELSRPKRL